MTCKRFNLVVLGTYLSLCFCLRVVEATVSSYVQPLIGLTVTSFSNALPLTLSIGNMVEDFLSSKMLLKRLGKTLQKLVAQTVL